MDFREYLLQPLIYGPLASLAMVLALLFLKRRLFKIVQRLAARTATRMDDLFLEAAGRPLNLIIVASGLQLLGRLLPLTEEADATNDLLYKGIFILALVWLVDRLARGLIDIYSAHIPFLSQARGVVTGLVRGLIVALGGLILLDSMGISITPLLASLGVGSLAVALALQGTLANLFAGIHLLADKAIEPGQYVRLESGQEGIVERIGWRSTRIRLRSNATLIVPNQKLVESVITNYELPASDTGITVTLGIHYDSDLDLVERVTIEVANEVMRQVEGGVPAFQTFVRFTAFGDSSISLDVVLRSKSYPDGVLVRHEFIKRLRKRYRSEGIVIPYPVRTLDIPGATLERLGPSAT
ncbi:MAG TPA: mechanosensitive ion channel family protein [Patescibacteria group bacterium]|nr:mechanosensitive ion channel family protein [Patescibacteria group bacterium]